MLLVPKTGDTFNVSIRILTDNKSLRKKVWIILEGSVQNSMIKFYTPLIPALFLISLKRTSKAGISRYVDMRPSRRAFFSKLKYGVVNDPFITHYCFSFIILLSTTLDFHQNQIFLKLMIKTMVKGIIEIW